MPDKVRRAFNMQDAEQATLGARDRVIEQGVVARHFGLELGDHGAARRNADSLDAF